MKRPLSTIRFIALALVTALPLGAGAQEAPPEAAPPEAPPAGPRGELPLEDLRVFADVFNQIRHSYVEEVGDRKLLESAIRGMLSGLDPHSVYLDATSFDDLQSNTTGEFGGLGLEVGMESGFVKVIAPIDDTPAQRAGLQPGDLIIKLDDEQVKGMSLQDAVEKMRGPRGSEITLTVVREGVQAPFEVTLKRDIIRVQSVKSRTLEPGFGYLRVAQFQSNTVNDFRRELAKLHNANDPLRGIVLDLRNNPGGLLHASVDIADVFLDDELVVYTEGRLSSSDSQYHGSLSEPTDQTPLVVLINNGSASASEIVAGALQDHKRALVIGTQSFGKGSVQTVLPLSQGRAIKLTTALYYTPNGTSIQAQGITPDITVERARIEEFTQGPQMSEATLPGHLSNGNGGGKKKRPEPVPSPDDKKDKSLAEEDNQLFEALNILKGVALMSERRPRGG